jgi:DNA gyrase inhibitor GyrI
MAAGRYAVFHYAGEVTGVADAYRGIYSCWFPESSVAPADFESHDHYIGDFPEAGQIELELWFRLRSRIAG